MKTQQQAEREEQQRIKNLVLNYDLRDGEEQDGEKLLPPLQPNFNIYNANTGLEKAAAANFARLDKSSNNRSGQRARKLQLSDVDWYAPKDTSSSPQKSSSREGRGVEAPTSSPVPQPIIMSGRRAPAAAEVPKGPRQHHGRSPVKAQGGRLTRREILAAHAAVAKAARSPMAK